MSFEATINWCSSDAHSWAERSASPCRGQAPSERNLWFTCLHFLPIAHRFQDGAEMKRECFKMRAMNQPLLREAEPAPGRPGIAPTWTSSAKDMVTTTI